MLCTPSRSNSRVSQASSSYSRRRSGNTTELATDDTDSPTPQRPRRNTARTQLYQSSEEGQSQGGADAGKNSTKVSGPGRGNFCT